MMRLVMIACLAAACGSKSKPAESTTIQPTNNETSTGGEATGAQGSAAAPGKVCDLDTPNSCPAGQTCSVPEGQPTRTGTCQ